MGLKTIPRLNAEKSSGRRGIRTWRTEFGGNSHEQKQKVQ